MFDSKYSKYGAGEGNRTPTQLPEPDFESGASTSSATPARYGYRRASISKLRP